MNDRDNPDEKWRRGPIRVSLTTLTKILALVVALVAVLALRNSCAHGVGNLFKAFEAADDAPPAGSDAGTR